MKHLVDHSVLVAALENVAQSGTAETFAALHKKIGGDMQRHFLTAARASNAAVVAHIISALPKNADSVARLEAAFSTARQAHAARMSSEPSSAVLRVLNDARLELARHVKPSDRANQDRAQAKETFRPAIAG